MALAIPCSRACCCRPTSYSIAAPCCSGCLTRSMPSVVAHDLWAKRFGGAMSVLAELNFGGRPRLPVVLAAEAAECGLACMTMIARYHGHDIDLNGLRQRFALSMTGATLRSLI